MCTIFRDIFKEECSLSYRTLSFGICLSLYVTKGQPLQIWLYRQCSDVACVLSYVGFGHWSSLSAD